MNSHTPAKDLRSIRAFMLPDRVPESPIPAGDAVIIAE